MGGIQQHTVQVTVREALALHTLVGGLLTLIVLVVVVCCCRRTCCSKEKSLKPDMESHGGWSSQSDVSISTENSMSEVSTGTQGTRVSLPQSVQNPEQLSISQ